jgi:hypothetical protein
MITGRKRLGKQLVGRNPLRLALIPRPRMRVNIRRNRRNRLIPRRLLVGKITRETRMLLHGARKVSRSDAGWHPDELILFDTD